MSTSTDRATWWQAALMIRGQTEADQRNIQSIWVWSFVWAAGSVAAMIGLKASSQLSVPIAWLLATVPIVLGILLARATLRFLRETDEFMRKVQLEGIATGFGAGWVFCTGYFAFEQAGAPTLPMIFAVLPMGFGWCIGSFLVAARYR